jgi:hypothetical protein
MSGFARGVTSTWGNLTYPTRNFATLGTFVTPPDDWLPQEWPGHFCLALHVAMQVGLSLQCALQTGEILPGVQSLRIPEGLTALLVSC